VLGQTVELHVPVVGVVPISTERELVEILLKAFALLLSAGLDGIEK